MRPEAALAAAEARIVAAAGEQAVGSAAAAQQRTPLPASARKRPRARRPVADEEGDGGGGAQIGAHPDESDAHGPTFPELVGAGLVRELHVYGQLVLTATKGRTGPINDPQHTGYGRTMMAHAEWLAAKAGCDRVAVISGIGARGYYRKLGYDLDTGAGGFMIKRLGARTRARALACAAGEAVCARVPRRLLVAAAGAAAAGLLLVLLPRLPPSAAAQLAKLRKAR